jgi:uncharacterized protein
MTDPQREAIAFLANPESYSPKPESVERRETHGAIVFLAGDHAYKLKRAVCYPYMDYSTPALRKAMCERELAVNRRTAPDLYLEVRPLVRGADGQINFGIACEAQGAIDWVVVMRRFGEADLLAEMRRRGEVTPTLMRRLGETIAEFHNKAESTSAWGGERGMRAVIDENVELLHRLGFDTASVARLEALSRETLVRVAPLLDRRRDTGFVRRCHGDLHLNNICLIAGQPVLFDAIEFNDAFSCIDVLYDLSFPLMDLLRHRLDPCANALLNRYLERTADYDGLAALPLFLSCRAAISAHVGVSRAEQTQLRINQTAAPNAPDQLLAFAVECLVRDSARLVAIGGVSGTGKSTLAYCLAPTVPPAPGAVVLRSDVIRKRLLDVPESSRLPESAYSPEMHSRIYAAVAERARSVVEAGYSVIVDAVFASPAQRAEVAQAADECKVPFSGLWLEAPTNLLEDRILDRRNDASDASAQILHAQLRQVENPRDWNVIDAGGKPEQTLALARAVLR